jgi:hypothetical protein
MSNDVNHPKDISILEVNKSDYEHMIKARAHKGGV